MGNVGIIGRARAGKDTAGKWLVDERGYRLVGFSDALRDVALRADPWIVHEGVDAHNDIKERLSEVVAEIGWEAAKDIPEVRRFLQELGTSMRTVDADVWIRPVLAKTREANDAGVPVFVSGVRFPNEAASLRRAGFHLVYIERPGVPHMDHESEGALTADDADYRIVNAGSLEQLRFDVECIWDRIYAAESRRHYARL